MFYGEMKNFLKSLSSVFKKTHQKIKLQCLYLAADNEPWRNSARGGTESQSVVGSKYTRKKAEGRVKVIKMCLSLSAPAKTALATHKVHLPHWVVGGRGGGGGS